MSNSHFNMVEERKSVNYAKFLAEMNERKSEKLNEETRDISTNDHLITLDCTDDQTSMASVRLDEVARPSVNEHYGFYQN